MAGARAAYGPTLPELLGPRRWPVVRAIAVVAALAAVVAVWRAGEPDRVVIGRGAPAFNYTYQAPLERFGATGVREQHGSTFVQSMVVDSLRLPAYRGYPDGVLPVLADRLVRRLAGEEQGFELIDEGRTRINESTGYYIAWEARLGARKLFARDYLLVPDGDDEPRLGAHLALRGTYRSGVASTDDVGRIGKLKRSLRSFRFGTERP